VFDSPQELRPASPPATGARKLVVFFDGTAQALNTGTNVAELFKDAQRQLLEGNAQNLHLFYIDGVGASGKPIGMAVSWGMGYRVRAAYQFLTERHRPGDEIYLIGFSRGAYSVRILASMLHNVGLPVGKGSQPAGLGTEQVERIYDAFKCGTWETNNACVEYDRATAVKNRLLELGLQMRPERVKFMGLWDTVEALGWPDYAENVDLPNTRYGDQLCNVERAVHGVALDDNRARIFTPILLTRRHLTAKCEGKLTADVEEVWFAGSHTDVGGGYEDGMGRLSGVSLNWMIGHASRAGLHLFNGAPRPQQDHLAKVHDAQSGFPWWIIYRRQYRDIDMYVDSPESMTNKIKFHACLIDRIESMPRVSPEYGSSEDRAQVVLWRGDGRTPGALLSCFQETADGKRKFKSGDQCPIIRVDECPKEPISR
jgi:uncharacterized protein (DUF2235 family)